MKVYEWASGWMNDLEKELAYNYDLKQTLPEELDWLIFGGA